MQKNEHGFTVIEVLLVLIFVAIIGFTGYYVWHSQKQTSKTLDAANSAASSTTPATKKKDSGTASSSGEAQQYLTVSEWGVKIPITSNYGLTYHISSDDPTDAALSSTQLVAADSDCSATNAAAGLLEKRAANETVGDDDTPVVKAAALGNYSYAHIGSYYYFYSSSQSACGSGSAGTLQTSTIAYAKAAIPQMLASK